MVTLAECQTVYSVEDLYAIMEIVTVDAVNRKIAAEHRQSRPPEL